MARIVDNDKGFKVIALTQGEAETIGFGMFEIGCLCMDCNEIIQGDIYYIAVLNDCMCKKHYKEWIKNNTRNIEDIPYEERYFNHYAKHLNLI